MDRSRIAAHGSLWITLLALVMLVGCSSASKPSFPDLASNADAPSATKIADAGLCDGSATREGNYLADGDRFDDVALCVLGPRSNPTKTVWVETSNCQIGEPGASSIQNALSDSLANPKIGPPMDVVRIVGHHFLFEYYYRGALPPDVDKVANRIGGQVISSSTVPKDPNGC